MSIKKTGNRSAREVALVCIREILEEGAYANLALSQALREAPLRDVDRPLVTDLVYGTVKYRLTLDWILNQFISRDLNDIPAWIRNILRMGVYQLCYMDRVPDSAACNESVELAKKYGHPGTVKFVNGVLRNVSRQKVNLVFPPLDLDPVGHISVTYSHPRWMVERWLERYGEEQTIALCRANNLPAPTWVRTNTLKITRERLARQLEETGTSIEYSRYVPEGLKIEGYGSMEKLASFRQGHFLAQDEASMIVAHALSPVPGAKIIDACAAPGGKTTHLAQMIINQGEITALDNHQHKLALIEDNCRRLGVTCVKAIMEDASRLGQNHPGAADFLLVDAPCSGLGVLRRRADARWRKEPEQVAEMARLQLEILAGAAGCLKPGGILVYSTCSIEPEENTGVLDSFLKRNGNFVPEDLAGYLPFDLPDHDRTTAGAGYLQCLPHVHGTDGFFMARLRRTGG
ncbi:MAG: 16S rRNA (cytosine(967)-C(5))-methyltransferase RsmB [Bacillota bacterium]